MAGIGWTWPGSLRSRTRWTGIATSSGLRPAGRPAAGAGGRQDAAAGRGPTGPWRPGPRPNAPLRMACPLGPDGMPIPMHACMPPSRRSASARWSWIRASTPRWPSASSSRPTSTCGSCMSCGTAARSPTHGRSASAGRRPRRTATNTCRRSPRPAPPCCGTPSTWGSGCSRRSESRSCRSDMRISLPTRPGPWRNWPSSPAGRKTSARRSRASWRGTGQVSAAPIRHQAIPCASTRGASPSVPTRPGARPSIPGIGPSCRP